MCVSVCVCVCVCTCAWSCVCVCVSPRCSAVQHKLSRQSWTDSHTLRTPQKLSESLLLTHNLWFCMSVCLSVCLAVCLFVPLSVCMICLPICLSGRFRSSEQLETRIQREKARNKTQVGWKNYSKNIKSSSLACDWQLEESPDLISGWTNQLMACTPSHICVCVCVKERERQEKSPWIHFSKLSLLHY